MNAQFGALYQITTIIHDHQRIWSHAYAMNMHIFIYINHAEYAYHIM